MPPKRRTTSRRLKRQQSKMLKQTLLIVVITLSLFLGFIFIVLPRVLGMLSDSPMPFEPNDSIPPQIPVLSAPVPATHSATLAIEGFGEKDSKVILILNGDRVEPIVVGLDGRFSTEIDLTEGENTLSAFGLDEAGNESSVSRSYNIGLDTEPPILELETPHDGQEIELRKNQVLTIKGKTEENSKIFVNGKRFFAQSDGSFQATHQLHEGENTLELVVEDKAGNKTEQKLTVKFRF